MSVEQKANEIIDKVMSEIGEMSVEEAEVYLGSIIDGLEVLKMGLEE